MNPWPPWRFAAYATQMLQNHVNKLMLSKEP